MYTHIHSVTETLSDTSVCNALLVAKTT